MIKQVEITLPEFPRGFHLIDDFINDHLKELPQVGLLNIFCKHSSAGLTINENADPSVLVDFESSFNNIVKEKETYYTHIYEGDDDMPAHIKSSLVGSSVTIPITDFKLNKGIWQGIYLCEFRNSGGNRNLLCSIYS